MMFKKIFLFLFLLIALAGAGLYGWFHFYALNPEDIKPKVIAGLSERIHLPVEIGSIQIKGLDQFQVESLKILERENGATVAEAPSLSGRLKWMTSLLGRAISLEASLESPHFHLRHDARMGWNFISKETPPKAQTEPVAEQKIASADHASREFKADIKAANASLLLEDEAWGAWRIKSPENLMLSASREKDSSQINLNWAGKFVLEEGALPESLPVQDESAARLLRAVDLQSARAGMTARAILDHGGVELISSGPDGFAFESATQKLSLQRFRLSIENPTGRKARLKSLNLEEANLELKSWRNPWLDAMRVPWISPPEGALKVSIRKGLCDAQSIQMEVSGFDIETVTFELKDLPWLRILTRKEFWRMADLNLSGKFARGLQSGIVEWDGARIRIANGEGGVITSHGQWHEGSSEWEAASSLEKVRIPSYQWLEDSLDPGLLSGEMTWGNKNSSNAAYMLQGKGSVIIENGEMAAIRMLGTMDELLNLQEVAHSRFESLSFEFDYSEERLAIKNLQLKSSLFDLSGEGSYHADNRIDVKANVVPHPPLALAAKGKKASAIVKALANSEPLDIGISGKLEEPTYSIVPSGGIALPIEDLMTEFGIGK